MAILSRLLVALGLDTGEFDAGMEDAERKAGTSMASIGRKLEDAGQRMVGVGKTMSLAVTTPLVAMGIAATSSASDLAESMSKVDVVFGESAAAVMAFAETSAIALGISEQKALEAAGTFGNLFTAMKIGQEESAGMSTSLVQLAADLASFNNIDPTQALEALRSGLTGETEPLKRFGVNLTAAGVELKALEMGLVEAGEELTSAAKAQAIYALILEQTATAQGDFARTSTGLANQTRIAKAQLADLTATMGQYLLPIGLQLAEMVNNILGRFQALSPETQKMIVTIGAVAAAIGPVLIALGTLSSAVGSVIGLVSAAGPVLAGIAGILTGPVGLAIAAVVAALGLLYAAWKNDWGGIRTWLTDVWETRLKPIFNLIVEWLKVTIPRAIDLLRAWWEEKLLPALRAVWNFLETYIIPLFRAVAEVAGAILGKAIEILAAYWSNILWPALQKVWQFLETSIIPVFQVVAQVAREVLGPPLQWLKEHVLDPLWSAFSRIGDIIRSVINWLRNLANAISSITLPSWLQPHSITPFEEGLRGISAALQELSEISLPMFEAQLRLLPEPVPDVGFAAGAGTLAMEPARAERTEISIEFNVERMDVSSREAAEREARTVGYLLTEDLRRRGLLPRGR